MHNIYFIFGRFGIRSGIDLTSHKKWQQNNNKDGEKMATRRIANGLHVGNSLAVSMVYVWRWSSRNASYSKCGDWMRLCFWNAHAPVKIFRISKYMFIHKMRSWIIKTAAGADLMLRQENIWRGWTKRKKKHKEESPFGNRIQQLWNYVLLLIIFSCSKKP